MTENEINNLKEVKSKRKKHKVIIVASIILGVLLLGLLIYILFGKNMGKELFKTNTTEDIEKKSKYRLSGNSLENFDMSFLKLEKETGNKVYSPLSIKYTLSMLNEGTKDSSKKQIENLIGDYTYKKYANSSNMSLANALFIKNTNQNQIKDDYITNLKNKYDAEVIFDDFASSTNINNWVKNKSLNLLDNVINDSKVSNLDMVLLNALAINMDWEDKFLLNEKGDIYVNYNHENFYWSKINTVTSGKFKDNDKEIAGMEIIASFNNYDIVKELGEDKIRETVGNELRKFLKENPDELSSGYSLVFGTSWDEKVEYTNENIEKLVNAYLDNYIKEINENYKEENRTTDFKLYVDDDVKVFSKDLKEYNDTTLQYIGIMPTNNDLDVYINNTDANEINNLINNLKSLKSDSFEDGVVTKITGFIPKFKFDYDLNLKNDLKKLGVKDVFDKNKHNLTGISDNNFYIDDVIHKSNIEFTQDGIKASAVTEVGGFGSGEWFDYNFDVPVKEIDMTFDKPYMFIIRDKATGEVWFMGTVYEPSSWENDPDYYIYNSVNQ